MFNFLTKFRKKVNFADDMDNLINNIKKSYEYSSVIENCNTATTIIVNYINNKVAFETISGKYDSFNRYNLLNVYLTLSRAMNCELDCVTIKKSFIINEIPIRTNPWNIKSVFDSFLIINDDNVLSAEKGALNIINSYLYPMNFVMCINGKHSQFAAISQGKGESFFTERFDFSKLYDLCRYDGVNFKDNDNKIVKLIDKYTPEEIMFAGILFEIGRVRIDKGFKNSYY